MIQVGEGKWKARCPVPDHQDHDCSLSVRVRGKAVLIHCFAGCSKAEVLVALGLKWPDLFGREEESVEERPVEPVVSPDDNEKLLAGWPAVIGNSALLERGIDNGVATFLGYKLHPEGVALPVRHEDRRVHGIQVRTGKRGRKYQWITPATYHVAGDIGGPYLKAGFRVTEGVIKADVATIRTSLPTVAINGVSSWRSILPLVERERPGQVVLAFDNDWKTKAGVRAARRDLAKALLDYRVDVFTEEWPDEYKGIDDYLAAGQPVCGIERRSFNP